MLASVFHLLSPARVSPSRVCRLISNSGHLKTEHFVLKADRLQLELDPGNFELLAARAEGNVEVLLASGAGAEEPIASAQKATYRTQGKRLVLDGCKGIYCDGEFRSFQPDDHDLRLSTGSP